MAQIAWKQPRNCNNVVRFVLEFHVVCCSALFSVNATSSTGVASTPASQANNTIVFITIGKPRFFESQFAWLHVLCSDLCAACVFGGIIFCCCFLYILPRVYYCCCLKRKVEKAQAKLAREIEQAQLESIKTQGEVCACVFASGFRCSVVC